MTRKRFYSWMDASRSEWGKRDYVEGSSSFNVEDITAGSIQRIADAAEKSERDLKEIAHQFKRFVDLMDPEFAVRKKEKEAKEEQNRDERKRTGKILDLVMDKIPAGLSLDLRKKIRTGLRISLRWGSAGDSLGWFDSRNAEHLIRLDGIGAKTVRKILKELKNLDETACEDRPRSTEAVGGVESVAEGIE